MTMTVQELLKLAFEQEDEHAFILIDAHYRVVSWAGAAAKLFGYSADEMRGSPLDRLFTPEDLQRGELANEYQTALSHGRADDDRWLLRKDGLRFWVSGALMVLRAPDGVVVGFSKIFRDRTEIKGHIDALKNRLDATQSADTQKSIFIGTLAHECGTLWGRS